MTDRTLSAVLMPVAPDARDDRNAFLTPARALAARMIDGKAGLADVHAELRGLGRQLLKDRLDRLKGQWTAKGRSANEKRIKDLIRGLAHDADGKLLPYDAFQALLERELGGFVITAHPTFNLSAEAARAAVRYLKGEADDIPRLDRYRSQRSPSLDEELAASERASLSIRRAIRRVNRLVLGVAAELYPADARLLAPSFVSVASWVGFDLDGRTDIGWSTSLKFRCRSAVAGIDELTTYFGSVEQELGAGLERPVAAAIAAVKKGLGDFRGCFADGIEKLETLKDDMPALNRAALGRRAIKEAALASINAALEVLVTADLPAKAHLEIAAFRAEWRHVGLGLTHIHFRLNAEQLHNAIRSEIGLDRAPDRSGTRRHYLSAIAGLLESIEPANVHYGTVAAEQTTAKRLFMLAAQFKKHFDGRTPIRLLIAESDTPFTLLTALYYARRYGVEDHVEISPLFETAIGLQRGDRVIAEVLDNPHFVDYIRAQGRFCVQLGFSDSGRFIGQPAACLAIERFKLRLVRLWKRRGLGDVQLLFFDTHGESIGRGAHPASLKDRFLYTHPPRVREFLDDMDVPHKHEVSFQGGDGYLWFVDEDTAFNTLTDFLDVRLSPVKAEGDPFYDDSGWALDFFLTLKEYQDHLVEHPGYVRLLDQMGPNLLFPTGSRATKRQAAEGQVPRLESVSQIRAIPHNAMLQQLGYMVNSVAGFGIAVSRSASRFAELHEKSDRLQRVTALVVAALDRSNVHALDAYLSLYDPGYWLDVADIEAGDHGGERRLSRALEGMGGGPHIGALIRRLRRDEGELRDALPMFEGHSANPQTTMAQLHMLRLALMHFVFLKAMEVPRFSTRLNVSLDELVERLLHMDVPATIQMLKDIFPATTNGDSDADFGEPSTDSSERAGYKKERATIFEPMREAYELMLDITGLIGLEIGAIG
ncbi:phosphoenolpyruvate carboxylase [Pseudokordiimonas caeni]|uniref:phosphoenolpyruvate carboxylase n=1 Tax=Pseudokordiimonas caeni TaxID=2997908 RepID=UPI00281245D6|nr:phosphoenolpyruvate carboxylase [Pseudokordiimonas caeni]